MTTSFTVRAIEPSQITVDFSDGSWANVPIQRNQTKAEILQAIAAFCNTPEPFESEQSVPFSLGEKGIVLPSTPPAEAKSASEPQMMTYADLRAVSYPLLGDQLDALYWARQGRNEKLAAMDVEIQAVKAMYPKDMPPITREEYDKIVAFTD